MSRKTLLTEAEVRQFLKLANIGPVGDVKLTEMYGEMPGARDDEDALEDEEPMADLGADDDLGDAEETVVVIEKKLTEAETNSRAIISIEKDIEYMKQTLDRIETLVSSI